MYIYISCINYDEIKKGGKGKICILCIFLHKKRNKKKYLFICKICTCDKKKIILHHGKVY